MRRRGRGHGNIFGDSEPEESLPEFDLFIHESAGRRRPAAGRYRMYRTGTPRMYRAPRMYRTPRTYRAPFASSGAHSSARRAVARPVRPWVLGLRLALCSIVLVLGLIGLAAEVSQAVGGYSDAGTMASAPTCESADPVTTTLAAACVATDEMVAPDGVFSDAGEESVELDPPSESLSNPNSSGFDFNFVSFPGNAQFDAAVGDGPASVRVEYWKGQIVTLTAGSQSVTVTTDQNPNNIGGVGVGGALMSLGFVLMGLLMFIGIRAIRLRWLHPGIRLRLFVCGFAMLSLGAFAAGVCLVNQPGRVALVTVIATPITVGLTALLWLALWSGHRKRVRLVSTVR
ncbi:hypothetical protein [Actinospica sp.]|jgi:hypothetical protein|uniref:hypothetical protein n=1 Tax=Actinospica sp. TaxID=1872142 RepID=UPI002C081829|nr:hypothetical protein [Actinospica sp.]HWG24039.1 hypothetical protein [Actinospica sp.]